MSVLKNFISLAILSLGIASFGFTFAACSGDDDSDRSLDAGFDGGVAKNKSKTTSQSGSGDSGGAEASAEVGPSCITSKTCGTTSCNSSDIDITALAATARNIPGTPCVEACCTADSKCGASAKITTYTPGIGLMVIIATTCTERDQPGIESEACPKFFEAFEAVLEDAGPMNWDSLESLDFAGCCRSDGTCGFLVSLAGLGCEPAADTRAMLSFAGLTDAGVKKCIPSSQ